MPGVLPVKYWNRAFVFWRMPSSEMLRLVAPVRTDVSEELIALIIRVTRISELRAYVASHCLRWRMPISVMLRCVAHVRTDDSKERIASIMLVTANVSPKRLFLQEPHSITSQNAAFFIAITWEPQILQLALFVALRFLSSWWWRRYVPSKRPFLQEPHCVISKKVEFFIVTTVKTSNRM
jgi:hypothetical protein